jgi:hypothetical protein
LMFVDLIATGVTATRRLALKSTRTAESTRDVLLSILSLGLLQDPWLFVPFKLKQCIKSSLLNPQFSILLTDLAFLECA